MVRNYLITACRNLIKSKAHSMTNVTGLSVGMAAATLGFWIHDELSFNKSIANYERVGEQTR